MLQAEVPAPLCPEPHPRRREQRDILYSHARAIANQQGSGGVHHVTDQQSVSHRDLVDARVAGHAAAQNVHYSVAVVQHTERVCRGVELVYVDFSLAPPRWTVLLRVPAQDGLCGPHP